MMLMMTMMMTMMCVEHSDPVRFRDDLRGCVSSGAALCPHQQRRRTASRRLQAHQVLPAIAGRQGAGHRCVAQHPPRPLLRRCRQQRTYTLA